MAHVGETFPQEEAIFDVVAASGLGSRDKHKSRSVRAFTLPSVMVSPQKKRRTDLPKPKEVKVEVRLGGRTVEVLQI